MNLNLCRIALKPRSPLEVFDLTLLLLRDEWPTMRRLFLLTVAPPAMACGVGAWLTEGHWAWALLPFVLAPWLQLPWTIFAGRLLFGDETGMRVVLGDSLGKVPALLGSLLIASCGWMLSIGTCLYGAIPVHAALLYLPEASLLEQVPPGRAARRTLRLAAGHAGIALVGAVARWALPLWMGLAFEAAGHAVVGSILQLGTPFGSMSHLEITPYFLFGVFAAQPLVALYRLLLYMDVRTRMEGWDLQVGLRAIALERQ